MKTLAQIINVIAWIIIFGIVGTGLVLAIKSFINDPLKILMESFNLIISLIVLVIVFGLMALVVRWSERVIEK
jgi:fucose permease